MFIPARTLSASAMCRKLVEFSLELTEQIMNIAVFNDFISYKAQRTGRFCACLVEANDRHTRHICLTKFNTLTGRWQRYFGDKYVGILQFVLCVYVDIFRLVRQEEVVGDRKPRLFDRLIQLVLVIVTAGVGNVNVHRLILSNKGEYSSIWNISTSVIYLALINLIHTTNAFQNFSMCSRVLWSVISPWSFILSATSCR